MLVHTTSLSIGNILFGFQSLFFYFSVIDAFWWFYTGSLKSALLLVVLLRGLLLVLLLSCYESLIFLMILYVIMQSIMKMQFPALCEIRLFYLWQQLEFGF